MEYRVWKSKAWRVNILGHLSALLEDRPNPPRSNKCTPSLARSSRGTRDEERTRAATEEEGGQGDKGEREKERMCRGSVGSGSRGYNPDRAFPGTRTWPASEDDQYGLCETPTPHRNDVSPLYNPHTSFAFRRDWWRRRTTVTPPRARVRRLLRARAPI